MQFVKLMWDGRNYIYQDSSNIKMIILGRFLSRDVSYRVSTWKDWALNDPCLSTCGNITSLDKLNGIVSLSDLYPEEDDESTEAKMTIKQFVQLLDDWETKVCKLKPSEVIITHENGEFSITTK